MKCRIFQQLSPFILVIFFSCSLFGVYDDIDVTPCQNPSQYNVVNNVTDMYGRVSLMNVMVDSVQIQKWVILPDSPADVVYEPCNLPYQVKKKMQRILFSADILQKVSPDTVVNGIIPIQLTALQKH